MSITTLEVPITMEFLAEWREELTKALQLYHAKRMEEVVARQEWDQWFGNALNTGHIAGKNEQIRLAQGIDLNPDLWLRFLEASKIAMAAKMELDEKMVTDKAVGRILQLMLLESQVQKSSADFPIFDS